MSNAYIKLGGRDYLEEVISEQDFGPVGNRHPSLMAWATGQTWQELVFGDVPKDLADIRGEWDPVWR